MSADEILRAAIARASSAAGSALRTATAIFGPTFETPMSARNAPRSVSSANPKRASASSRTCVCTQSVTRPASSARARPERAERSGELVADAADVEDDPAVGLLRDHLAGEPADHAGSVSPERPASCSWRPAEIQL